MTGEDKQLTYREERAEAAMFHICRELYEIDVPNHPVKDAYRMGFDEGVEYAKKILIEKACEWWEQRQGDYDLYDVWCGDYVSFKHVIMEFREAMEKLT